MIDDATLLALSDRAGILDAHTRYAQGVDQRDWPLYLSAFTDDAIVELTLVPDARLTPAEFRDMLTGTYDSIRLSGQHALSNPVITVAGDSANSVIEFFATTLEGSGPGGESMQSGSAGLYVDRLRRTPGGWRITHRTLVLKTSDGHIVDVPDELRNSVLFTSDGGRNSFTDRPAPTQPEGDPVSDIPAALSLEELADRAAIDDTLVAYCHAQDQNRWELFDLVFTPDAVIELAGVADTRFDPETYRGLLTTFNETRLSGQHSLSNTLYRFSADRSRARTVTELAAVTLQRTEAVASGTDSSDGVPVKRIRSNSLYVDDLVRTTGGWRISRRVVMQKNIETEEVHYDAALLETITAGTDHDWFTDAPNGAVS